MGKLCYLLFCSLVLFCNSLLLNAQPVSIVDANASFKYLDDGSNPGMQWRYLSYDDSSWPQGSSVLGYGDHQSTIVNPGIITYYFRKNISISDPSEFSGFIMKIRRDDGIIVFINGNEVYRNNVPSGNIDFLTRATTACSDDGDAVFSIDLPSSAFIDGANIIAAEVHNRSTHSSDITFDLQLIGNSNPTAGCGMPDVDLFGTLDITGNSAIPYWEPVENANAYNIAFRIRNSGEAYSSAINVTEPYISLTGLTPSTNYEFIVQSNCDNGNSAYSPSGWFTTSEGATATCDPPDVALFGTRNRTDVSAQPFWSAVDGAQSYNVSYRIRNSGDAFSSADNTSIGSITLNGLQPSTNYEFIVQSVCNDGSLSVFSPSGWFSTLPSSTTVCTVPTGLSILDVTNTNATVYWDGSSDAGSYTIQYREIGSTNWITLSSTVATIQFVNLSIGTDYEFRVLANCDIGPSGYSAPYTFSTGSPPVSGVPQFDHIVVVIGENTNASSVFGSSSAPYINGLAQGGAGFTESYAITHPSQPNYLDLFAGANQGVTNDNTPSSHFNTPNLARELINIGKTFGSYCEGMPSIGYDGSSSGDYVRKHNAVANWMGSGSNQVSSALNMRFVDFPSNYNNLPDVSFVIPDLCSDGHDVCPPLNNRTLQFDRWIQTNLDGYRQYCANPANNSLLIVTYDEDDFTPTNRIFTVFYGAHVLSDIYTQGINHFSVLRTMEDAMGLTTHAGAAATNSPITFCWTSGSARSRQQVIPEAPVDQVSSLIVYPNPVRDDFTIQFNSTMTGKASIKFYTTDGALAYSTDRLLVADNNNFTFNRNDILLRPGIYLLEITAGINRYQARIVVQE